MYKRKEISEKKKGKKKKGKGRGKGKGKGKCTGRKRWGPRNKGPKRSQSRTRGYASNTSGRQMYTDKIPFLKSHLNDTCQSVITRLMLVNQYPHIDWEI